MMCLRRQRSRLEPHDAHFRGDAEACGADEDQPLAEEVRDEDEKAGVRHRLDEAVPGEDEVGEDEEQGAECVEAAPLEHGRQKHEAYDAGIYAGAGAYEAGRSERDDAREGYGQQHDDAEHDHGEVAFSLAGELAVMLDLGEVSLGEEPDQEYVGT